MIGGSVVVGYDGSDASRRALLRARDVTGRGGEIVVVSVARTDLPDELAPLAPGAPAPTTAELLQEAAATLGDGDATVATRAEQGDPAEALIDAAAEVDADLIVVGARGGDFVARTLLGSVAAKLIARAPCDVLVTR